MAKAFLLVGLGGSIGSMLRFATTLLFKKLQGNGLTLATLAANILGCLLMGIFFGLFRQKFADNEDLNLLFLTGFCGGYTTFSAFALENVRLLQSNQAGIALIYILLSVIAGMLALWLGLYFTR